MVLEIVDRVRQLAMIPDSGRMVPELETPWLRELEHPPFRIVYRRGEAVVTVVRVWRSERLMDPGLVGRNA
jgi:plasmid stabilization system protein ParE